MIRRLTVPALLGLPTIVPVQAMGMVSAEFYDTQAHTNGRILMVAACLLVPGRTRWRQFLTTSRRSS